MKRRRAQWRWNDIEKGVTMQAIYPLLAFLVGVVVPMQAAVNNQLRQLIGGSTLLAALVSFSVGCLTLALLSLATGQRWQSLAALSRVEWWMLLGGVLGAGFVFGTTLLAPRLGVATMVSLIIAGQVCTSLLFDRFGWLAMPLRDLSAARLIGALLVVAGVLLVNFGDRWFGR
ncbi:DMT family transporter [Chromobacterium sinusclupearum]|nr:DMT family transporter [Chromobacterium sinusclupearum]